MIKQMFLPKMNNWILKFGINKVQKCPLDFKRVYKALAFFFHFL